MSDQQRRRIDRVTDPAYLADLDQRSVADVRTMRDDCHEEEIRLSYARRLVQGQIDIVRAERQRREGGGSEESLVGALAQILADDPGPRSTRAPRSAPVFSPSDGTYGAREHDTSADDAAVGRVPDLDDAELTLLEERLAAKEQHISGLRRTVLDHLDALSDEMVRRYRDGGASVDDIVTESAAAPDSAPSAAPES